MSESATDDLLQLDGVGKSYGNVQALKDVTATVARGTVGLLGPNGAGKSTLLKILLGLLVPTAGRAQVIGFDAASRSLDLRQRIGYMPEQECHINGLDAVELCTYAAELCGLPYDGARSRANSVLAYVGLGDKRHLKVQSYSTGQKQRVKLAQALVHDPELLLLDEPTNGLDPRGRDEMLRLIRELPEKRGCSVMVSSHLLPDVEAVCENALVLAEGALLFSGPIEQLRGTSNRYYRVGLKESPQAFAIALRAVGARADLVQDTLKVELPEGEDPDLIFRCARENDLQIRHLELEQRSFEEAFLDLLQEKSAP